MVSSKSMSMSLLDNLPIDFCIHVDHRIKWKIHTVTRVTNIQGETQLFTYVNVAWFFPAITWNSIDSLFWVSSLWISTKTWDIQGNILKLKRRSKLMSNTTLLSTERYSENHKTMDFDYENQFSFGSLKCAHSEFDFPKTYVCFGELSRQMHDMWLEIINSNICKFILYS